LIFDQSDILLPRQKNISPNGGDLPALSGLVFLNGESAIFRRQIFSPETNRFIFGSEHLSFKWISFVSKRQAFFLGQQASISVAQTFAPRAEISGPGMETSISTPEKPEKPFRRAKGQKPTAKKSNR